MNNIKAYQKRLESYYQQAKRLFESTLSFSIPVAKEIDNYELESLVKKISEKKPNPFTNLIFNALVDLQSGKEITKQTVKMSISLSKKDNKLHVEISD